MTQIAEGQLTQAEFTALMSRLRACYQNPVADEALWALSLRAYWDVLQRYDHAHVRAALRVAWRAYPRWMPSLAQLVALVEGGDKPTSISAAEAWPEVMRIASGNGSKHSDPVADHVIRLLGGARALGQQQVDVLERFTRQRFENLYTAITGHRRTQDAQARLTGQLQPEVKQLIDGVANAAKLPAE